MSRYYLDIQHPDLGKFRRISGTDEYVVEQKAREQLFIWDEQWAKRCRVEDRQQRRNELAQSREAKREEAAERTAEAQEALDECSQIIQRTLTVAQAIDWAPYYDRTTFAERPPQKPADISYPAEPSRHEAKYQPKKTFLSLIFPHLRRKYEQQTLDWFERVHRAWHLENERLQQTEQQHLQKYQSELAAWQHRKSEFTSAQTRQAESIDQLKARYIDKDETSIIDYTDLVLGRSEYPDLFPAQWDISFSAENGMMIIDYELPSVDVIPNLKSVKYIQSRDDFEEQFYRENETERLYDSLIYQTCLRTLKEILSSDIINAIRAVTFNGWVDFIDRSNGQPTRACIISLQTTKEKFDTINLNAVDPKACFRSLKGIGSAKLAGMAPVVPILRIDKSDERFVPAQSVIGSVSTETNLAAIPWEAFEHLVRDVFEREFSAGGGEVKITRASRDHGVDAIAFDPDPIRGGKIVIQAKRYTNVVGVSAVRDLYGTVINEGASRGILVTTSVYGADSYDFAKDKPLTLLNGGNLLHLLAKHGHSARIDLGEAKRLAAEHAR